MKCNSTQKRTIYELSAIQKRWSSSKKHVFRKKCAKIYIHIMQMSFRCDNHGEPFILQRDETWLGHDLYFVRGRLNFKGQTMAFLEPFSHAH